MQVDITDEMAREDIIIFPDDAIHLNMAESMKRMYSRKHRAASCVVSAGFVNLASLECFGKSESLNMESRGDKDSALIIAGKYGLNLVNKE